jgi:hypothetical protein
MDDFLDKLTEARRYAFENDIPYYPPHAAEFEALGIEKVVSYTDRAVMTKY